MIRVLSAAHSSGSACYQIIDGVTKIAIVESTLEERTVPAYRSPPTVTAIKKGPISVLYPREYKADCCSWHEIENVFEVYTPVKLCNVRGNDCEVSYCSSENFH